MRGMDAIVAAFITAMLGTLGGYIVGNRRQQYAHLYERRADMIAELTKLLSSRAM